MGEGDKRELRGKLWLGYKKRKILKKKYKNLIWNENSIDCLIGLHVFFSQFCIVSKLTKYLSRNKKSSVVMSVARWS